MEIAPPVEYIEVPVRQVDITFKGGEVWGASLGMSIPIVFEDGWMSIDAEGAERKFNLSNVLWYQVRNTTRKMKPPPKPSVSEPLEKEPYDPQVAS